MLYLYQPCEPVTHNMSTFSLTDESELRHSELVNYYLKEVEGEIDSEAELIERKTLVEKVIYRLIHHVRDHLKTLIYLLFMSLVISYVN